MLFPLQKTLLMPDTFSFGKDVYYRLGQKINILVADLSSYTF